MPRPNSRDADAILDHKIPVLDHGFVVLIDYMGNDRSIAEKAWQSTTDSDKIGEKSDKAAKRVIFEMMRKRHTTPFEFVELVFHVRLPIFTARQWIRHRTASTIETSGRYQILKHEAYVPTYERINPQPIDPEVRDPREIFVDTPQDSFHEYEWLIEDGVARELARINLPLSTYTEWKWKINLHNLFNFLRQRLDKHAQWEFRRYAEQVLFLTEQVVPIAVEAFREHVLHAVTLSRSEMRELRSMIDCLNDIGISLSPGLKGAKLDRFCAKLGIRPCAKR